MKYILMMVFSFVITFVISQETMLKPYILGGQSDASISEVKTELKAQLKANNIKVLGEYAPAGDSKRWVISVTSDELISAVKSQGGFTGFAAAWRVGITSENGKTFISYNNPTYWGNAYFQNNFGMVKSQYEAFETKMEKAMEGFDSASPATFGSRDGLSVEKLKKYRYMLAMPHFKDTKLIHTFGSFEEAKAFIDGRFDTGTKGVKKVYSVEVPGKKIKLYGVSLSGEKGEAHFLPIIDLSNPKHTAFLPYELLIVGKEVHMLHGRFRIALSFPDLKMGTFTKIMSTPNDILHFMARIVVPDEG